MIWEAFPRIIIVDRINRLADIRCRQFNGFMLILRLNAPGLGFFDGPHKPLNRLRIFLNELIGEVISQTAGRFP